MAAGGTTASEIKAALMRHFSPPGHRVFFEVSNDTGASARRWIDALAVGIWPSTGFEIVGIEIKVSRSDWLRELQQPQKSQELMRFCTRWYLACPDRMVKPDELPATWGMMGLREDGKFRITRAALQVDPQPLTPGFVAAVLRNAWSVDPDLVGQLVAERRRELEDEFDRRLESEVRRRSDEVRERTRQAEEVAARITALAGESPTHWTFDPEAFAATYRLLKSSSLHSVQGFGNEALPHILDNLARAHAGLAALFDLPALVQLRAEMQAAKPALPAPVRRRAG